MTRPSQTNVAKYETSAIIILTYDTLSPRSWHIVIMRYGQRVIMTFQLVFYTRSSKSLEWINVLWLKVFCDKTSVNFRFPGTRL